jgi:hypothetical protein
LRGDGEGKQLTYAKFTLFRYIKLYYFMVVLHVRSTGPTGMDELRSTREVEVRPSPIASHESWKLVAVRSEAKWVS